MTSFLVNNTFSKESNTFEIYSALTNGSYHQLNLEWGEKKKLDFSFGFSFAQESKKSSYSLQFRFSKNLFKNNNPITPYLLFQAPINHEDIEGRLMAEDYMSYGLLIGIQIIEGYSLGFDLRKSKSAETSKKFESIGLFLMIINLKEI